MSASKNLVILIGNLGADPELRTMPNGNQVCNLRLATTFTYKDSGGQKREEVTWHRVVVFGAQAEHCSKFLRKGSSVSVDGRIKTNSYEKDGVKQYSTEIVASQVLFLTYPKDALDQRRSPADEERSEIQFPPEDDLNF